MKRVDCPFRLTTDFAADIPAAETFIFSVVLPDLVNHIFIVFDFPAQVARIPVPPGVIQSEIILHAVLVREAQKHVHQIDRRHITTFAQQVF